MMMMMMKMRFETLLCCGVILLLVVALGATESASESQQQQRLLRGLDLQEDRWRIDTEKGVLHLSDATVVKLSKVNDDYCDSVLYSLGDKRNIDISDEYGTSACSGVEAIGDRKGFYCVEHRGSSSGAGDSPDEGSLGHYIPLSLVDDGICDCCDGSDESKKECPNTCKATLSDRISEAKDRRELVLSGNRKRLQYVQKLSKKDFSEAPKRIQKYLKGLDDEYSQIVSDMNAGRISRDKAQAKGTKLQQKATWVTALEPLFQGDTKSNEMQTTFGKALEYLQLLFTCYSITLDEKQLRGGTTRTEGPEVFTFQVCPFANVTQQSVTLPDNDPVLLGLWSIWKKGAESPTMVYGDGSGDACYGGPQRRVELKLECGLDNKIVTAAEDGLCLYYITLETPAACKSEMAFTKPIESLLALDIVL